MSAWTGTRVPANIGVPLRMSGDDVTMGCPMGPTLLSIYRSAQGAERVAAALNLLARGALYPRRNDGFLSSSRSSARIAMFPLTSGWAGTM